jgi:hypothetical protein
MKHQTGMGKGVWSKELLLGWSNVVVADHDLPSAHQRHLNPPTPFLCALYRRNAVSIAESKPGTNVFSKA